MRYFLFFFLVSNYIFSCDCLISNGSFIETCNNTNYIFKGEVLKIEKIVFENQTFKKVTFNIVDCYKGNINKKITVFTNYLDTACGLDIKKNNEVWIIWATKWKELLLTDQCTKSKLFNDIDKSTLEILEELKSFNGYKTWTDSFQMKGEGFLKNFIPEGKWTYYYRNYKTIEGNYKNGLKDGQWIYYYTKKIDLINEINTDSLKSENKIRFIENYNNGLKHGDFLQYSTSNKLIYKKTYKNDKLDGTEIIFLENGNLKKINNYRNGKLDGLNLSFHKNNTIELISYSNKEKPMYEWLLFDSNGTLLCKSSTKKPVYDFENSRYKCPD